MRTTSILGLVALVSALPSAVDAAPRPFAPSGPAAVRSIAGEPAPSRVRAAVYAMGLIVQAAIRDCAVDTTAAQRTALAGKVDALRAEMGPLDAQIRAGVTANPVDCPGPEDQADFRERLQHFIDKSPEELFETMSRNDGKP